MTDLQISLIAIGLTILIGVISYNKWQEYKAKKTVERAFAGDQDDVLMAPDADRLRPAGGMRAEPTFVADDDVTDAGSGADADETPGSRGSTRTSGNTSNNTVSGSGPGGGTGAAPIVTAGADRDTSDAGTAGAVRNARGAIDLSPVEQVSDSGYESASGQTNGAATPSQQKELPVDVLVDCVIPLALGSNLRGEKVIGPIQSLRHVGNKPVNFVGQREDGNWEAIQHGAVYSALLAGIQLANRSTALNEIEFSEMVTRLRQVADELDAEPDVPNMTSVMQSARALQQFVSQYDAQLSVNIQAKGVPWSISTLLAALERQGFDVRPDGRLVMPDGDGGNLFTLSTNVTLAAESTSRLTLLLDVPCVAPERDGFGAMVACARSLSHRLDGVVVDDGDQPLSDAALGEIGEQVQSFCSDMQTADIPAGSPRALRLFS